jgi:drug/metabolite transporter (DMT)-like permease
MDRPPETRFGASDALMFLAVVIWGINFTFIKIGLRELSPGGFNGLRILLTAVLFLAILGLSRRGFGPVRKDLWKLALLGIAGNTLYQFLFISAVSQTSASNTSLILSMSPIFVALLSVLFRIERVHWAAWLGILVSFAGLYLILAEQDGGLNFSAVGFRGDVMIFFGTMLWAAYTVWSKPFLDKLSPLQFATVTMVFGALFYVPVTIKDIARIPWASVSARAWAGLVLSSVFGLVVGYLIWYYSVHKIGNAKTAIYSNLTPIFTIFFAVLFLGERVHAAEIIGAAVILTGVYLTRAGYKFFLKNGRAPDSS